MDKIEKIRQEIKELGELLEDHNYYLDNSEQALGYSAALDDIEKFLDSLESEKPINLDGLDQEIIKCWQEWISPSNKQSVEGVLPLSEFAFYARHFAQWQKEQMMKEAVEIGTTDIYWEQDGDRAFPAFDPPVEDLLMPGIISQRFNDGDKVRIIIVKE